MTGEVQNDIAEDYFSFIDDKEFPCVAAKAAYARDQVQVLVCDHIACPKDDYSIIQSMNLSTSTGLRRSYTTPP